MIIIQRFSRIGRERHASTFPSSSGQSVTGGGGTSSSRPTSGVGSARRRSRPISGTAPASCSTERPDPEQGSTDVLRICRLDMPAPASQLSTLSLGEQDPYAEALNDRIRIHHEVWHGLAFEQPATESSKIPRRGLVSWRGVRNSLSVVEESDIQRAASLTFESAAEIDTLSPVSLAAPQPSTPPKVGRMRYPSRQRDGLAAEATNMPFLMVHPMNSWKVAWDIFVSLLILYSCISVPLNVGFDIKDTLVLDIIVCTLFSLDMLVSFRTAYVDEQGTIVTDQQQVALRYIKGWFLLDLLSTVPFDLMFGSSGLESMRLLRILRLIRLVRLLKVARLMAEQENGITERLHPSLWALAKMFLTLAFIAHLMGCAWHWMAELGGYPISWVTFYGIENEPIGMQYLASVYWAFTTMTTVGYGDIIPTNDRERGFAILGMIVGASVFGYIIGNMTVIMENFDVEGAIEKERMDQLHDWLRDRKFPQEMANRMQRQMRYLFRQSSVLDGSDILDVVPGICATSIIFSRHHKLVARNPFLRDNPPFFVAQLLRIMMPFFAVKGDVLYREGEVGTHWFVLKPGGTVLLYAVRSSLDEKGGSGIAHFDTLHGACGIGADALLVDSLQGTSAVAASSCDLLSVPKSGLVQLLDTFPDVAEALVAECEAFIERLESWRWRSDDGCCTVTEGSLGIDSVEFSPPPELRPGSAAPLPLTPERQGLMLSHSPLNADASAVLPSARKESSARRDSVTKAELAILHSEGEEGDPSLISPRTLLSKNWIFHPDSTLKVVWDCYVSVLIVWSVVEVTIRLGFDLPVLKGWIAWSAFIDSNFFLDILISFRTAYHTHDGVLVVHPKAISRRYLRGWFPIDFISTLPLDAIMALFIDDAAAIRSTKLIRAFRLVRLVKLLRLLKMSAFFEEYEHRMPIGPNGMRLAKLVVFMFFAAHLNACMWYAAGLATQPTMSWISDYCDFLGSSSCLSSMGLGAQYLGSIYYAFTTMTTVGYGDITPNPHSATEMLIAILSEIIGTSVFAWVIGNVVNLILNMDPTERNRKHLMGYLNHFLRGLSVSHMHKSAIKQHYGYHLAVRSVFNERAIMSSLPPMLITPVRVFLSRAYLPQLKFLCSVENAVPGALALILPELRPASFAPGDIVMTPRIAVREMWFITRGDAEARIATSRDSSKTVLLKEGGQFGEAMILLPEFVKLRGLAQVRAGSRDRTGGTTPMHAMSYSRAAFASLQESYPTLGEYISKQLYHPASTFNWVVVSEKDAEEKRVIESLSEQPSPRREMRGSFVSLSPNRSAFRDGQMTRTPSPRHRGGGGGGPSSPLGSPSSAFSSGDGSRLGPAQATSADYIARSASAGGGHLSRAVMQRANGSRSPGGGCSAGGGSPHKKW